MERHTKDKIQYGSAVAMLASGILLTFICFFLNHYDIKDSVLYYVAQTLVYAGSIFGVSVYIQTKFGDVKTYVDKQIHKDNEKD